MVRIPLQALGGRTPAWFPCWRRQGLLPRSPDRRRRLDAHYILQSALGEGGAEWCAVSIAGVRQNHSYGNLLFQRLPNLLQSNLWLGLKLDRFGNSGLPASVGILAPHLRQI